MGFVPNTKAEQLEMLKTLGCSTIEDLFGDIPEELRLKRPLNLPEPLAEYQLIKYMTGLASKNKHLDHLVSFLGAGAYDHIVPSVIKHLVGRGEFLTAYTPYQAEISQGVLQAIFEFQTLIVELTNMEVANASMYDGASALAEAALLACNYTRRDKIGVPKNLHPEWLSIVKVYLESQDLEVIEIPYQLETGLIDLAALNPQLVSELAGIVVAQPNFFGGLEDVSAVAARVKDAGGLLIMAVDPLSLGLLKAPGDIGADIVVGDAGCLGSPISFGGPSVGFFAVSGKNLVRRMPGRIVGATTDAQGNTGYVLTLQTREQHIRREKATSNICTNQALNALIATIYLALLGKTGIKEVGYQCIQKANYLKQSLLKAGFKLRFNRLTFKEFVVQAELDWQKCNERLLEHGYLGGLPLAVVDEKLADSVLLSVTEARTKAEIDEFVALLRRYSNGV